ncbi:hypothetical protein VZT92_017079 [Zoarces viviparus]|uniref:Uncharacterized protein n=1 Tax=Zoarces viviparus TaxID=48416 RepID=A0AAW1ETT4_ZOAVI
MGALMMHMCLVAALGAPLCGAAPVSGSLEVLIRTPVRVQLGQTTTLPCWLNPPQSADGLEVSWYLGGHYDTPVMYYRAKKFENASQEASYVGRVSFGLKDAASVGLTAGDVSLKLEKATVEDAGDYTCYVSSEQGYDSASVRLIVTEMGTPPLLSAVWKEDNTVNMSLGISDEQPKEARVRLENSPQTESGSLAAGWVLFALLLTAMLVSLGVLYWKRRGEKAKSNNAPAEENDNLLPKESDVIQPTSLSEYSKCYVNVTLEQTENRYLTIKGSKLRDAPGDFPDGDQVTCITAIKGTPGFSSGRHYWEVSLGRTDPNVGLKKSWWVGVTSATVIPEKLDFTPTASHGFWFLSSNPNTDSFQFSTEPNVLLPVDSRPQTVGVFLNYDSGELSFYNVEDERLIGSLTATFTAAVFPFFNPGKGDKAAMEILQRDEPVQSRDMGNSVESTAQETES